MSQWAKRLDEVFSNFNADPQNGKMLNGKSPVEMWSAGLDAKPLKQLPDDARYLLSTHKKIIKVRQEGIVLNIGGERLLYCNDKTGELIGQEVLAHYNIDFPDLLTVSDLNRQNSFAVKRILLPAMSATRAELGAVHTQINGHRKAAKTIYGNIARPVVATIIHDDEQSEDVKELGRFHNAQEEQAKTEQSEIKRKLRKISVQAASAGLVVPSNIRNPDRVQAGIDLEKEVRARIALRQSALKNEAHNE